MPRKTRGRLKERTRLLNARQEAFCNLFIACGIATQAYRDAGYAANTQKSVTASSSQLLARPHIQARVLELRDQSNVKALRKDISKEALLQKLWEIVHDPSAKRGESIQAGIQVAKMAGWNAATRVEHDLGDRVRAYLEDIRSRPLRTIEGRVVQRLDDKRDTP